MRYCLDYRMTCEHFKFNEKKFDADICTCNEYCHLQARANLEDTMSQIRANVRIMQNQNLLRNYAKSLYGDMEYIKSKMREKGER